MYRRSCYRFFLFLLPGLLLVSTVKAENWHIRVDALNFNPNQQDEVLIDHFIIGEHANASNGYDAYDIPKLFPPSHISNYICSYILHTTWGTNNGAYHRDYRSTEIELNNWNVRILRHNPYGNSNQLLWEIPDEFPPYYRLQLIRGTTIIDMRNQNSYSYNTSGSGTISFQIRTTPLIGIPYVTNEIDSILFSDNLEQEINLLEHFGILNSPLSFSLRSNQFILQEIVIEDDIPYWRFYPLPGWTGTTEVTINAHGNSGSISLVIPITRDDTNSPPYYTYEDETVEMIQNLDSVIDLNNTIHDDDLDPVTISVQSGQYVQAEYDSLAKTIHLSPNPAFKGNDVITLILNDGVNEPNETGIEINVLPSEPKAVQNVVTAIEHIEMPERTGNRGSEEILTFFNVFWDEVTEDINDLPVTGIIYRVMVWEDPAHVFDEETARIEYVTENFISLETTSSMLFLKVTAVNP